MTHEDLMRRIAAMSPEARSRLEQLLLNGADSAGKHEIPRRQGTGPCAPSFAQQRLWFLEQFEPGASAYNCPTAYRLRGRLNRDALQEALNTMVRRHESLRTNLVSVDARPMQVVRPHASAPMSSFDVASAPPDAREKEARRILNEEARRPFDLATDLMLRSILIRLAEDDHAFLLVVHHIAWDGWSSGVFWRELTALYRALATGETAALPELPVQYADYACWQRELLHGEALEGDLSYWRGQLAGAPVLELPACRPRPPVESHRGAEYAFTVPPTCVAAMRRLGHGEGATLFMTLAATLNVLFHRYTGQDDIVIGCPVANRSRVELEGLIGFFVNTLALRTDLSGNPSFRELLGRVRSVALQAYAHQDIPFDKLVEELHPERDLSRMPVVQVMFGLQSAASPPDLPGLTCEALPVHTDTAKFDLFWDLVQAPHGLAAGVEYATDLFDRAAVERMTRHWTTLLEGIAADPDRRIGSLPLLTEAERHLFAQCNATETPYPSEACLHDLFEAQAERTPEATALEFGAERWTFAELNRRADRLAARLRRMGVGPESLVGICVDRSADMVAGLLAILKAGGAYVPLDPAYPRDRLAFMLDDARIGVVLARRNVAAPMQRHDAKVVYLDEDDAADDAHAPAGPGRGATATDPAYVIYTSGSTGHPKGVVGLHRGAVNRLAWMWARYPFEPGEVCCQKTPLSFVDSAGEIFGPLLRGVPTVILPDAVVGDPRRLVQALVDHHVTRIILVPSLLRALLDSEADLGARLPALRLWVSSGEALPVEVCERFRKAVPHAILLNLYGSTEVAADVTCFDTRNMTADLASVPIGRPIANTHVHILDRYLNPVPINVPGELCAGGAGLARGYLNRPELTTERFIRNPFDPGARLYRTGDRARYLPGGDIEFLGRSDDQVKVRGFRVEPGEIERALSEHPAVGQAVVAPDQSRPGDTRLIAYVVSRPGGSGSCEAAGAPPPGELAASELRSFLKEKLPDYMVPAGFVLADSLPLTPSGKVDRKALRPPDAVLLQPQDAFAAPRTPVEEVLSDLWAGVLRVPRVSIHGNFFELGGHSLLAMRLVSRIRDVFHVDLPVRRVFDAPTVAALAEVIERTREQSPDTLTPAIPRLPGAEHQKHRMERPSEGGPLA